MVEKSVFDPQSYFRFSCFSCDFTFYHFYLLSTPALYQYLSSSPLTVGHFLDMEGAATEVNAGTAVLPKSLFPKSTISEVVMNSTPAKSEMIPSAWPQLLA